MGIRGELYTTQINFDNRSYFFNVKENRNHDVFLQIVESKVKDGQDDRRAIVVFADDMQEFLSGMDQALTFIEKDRKERPRPRQKRKPPRKPNSARVNLILMPQKRRFTAGREKAVLLPNARPKRKIPA